MKVDRAVFRNLHLATAMTLVGLLFFSAQGLRSQDAKASFTLKLSGAGADSIPVPIGHQDWQFVATAVRNAKGKWERHGILTASGDEGEGFVPSTPDDNAIYGYPLWTHLSSTDCGVSQEVK